MWWEALTPKLPVNSNVWYKKIILKEFKWKALLLQWLMYLSLLAFLFNNDDGKHSIWFIIQFFLTKLCVSCVYICKYWMTPYIHTLILNIFRNDIDKTLHRSYGVGSAIVGIVWIRMPQKWTWLQSTVLQMDQTCILHKIIDDKLQIWI
mgnify:CR=1 FL=1